VVLAQRGLDDPSQLQTTIKLGGLGPPRAIPRLLLGEQRSVAPPAAAAIDLA